MRRTVVHYSPKFPGRKRARKFHFWWLVVLLLGGPGVLVLSFFATFAIIDYVDTYNRTERAAATKDIWPTNWTSVGKASYELRNGAVILKGPDAIYTDIACGSFVSNIRFSIFVQRARAASMQLQFLSSMGPIGKTLVQEISGVTNKTAEILSPTRQGSGTLRAVIHGVDEGEAVVFKDAHIECRPVD
jgi:hypothetical protein